MAQYVTYLALVRAPTYVNEHRPERSEERVCTAQQFHLTHACYPLANLVLGIAGDLVQLFLLFRLVVGRATDFLRLT